MNKAASNQIEDDLKIVCFDIYVSNFWKILANRVHFLEQLQGLSLHLYQKKKKIQQKFLLKILTTTDLPYTFRQIYFSQRYFLRTPMVVSSQINLLSTFLV